MSNDSGMSSFMMTTTAAAVAALAAYYGSSYLQRSSETTEEAPAKSEPAKRSFLLVGDIGGTNSRLALYDADSETKASLYHKEYPNSSRLVLETLSESSFGNDIVNYFLTEAMADATVIAAIGDDKDRLNIVACFACAGPVASNRVVMTNIGPAHPSDAVATADSRKIELVIDGGLLEASKEGNLQYVSRAKIINDFVGQGYGALDLDLSESSKEVRALSPNSRAVLDPKGPKACIGAGTGLGECFLTPDASGSYTCFPSEGGHVEYAPRTELEMELLAFLKNKFSSRHRVSVERVVSGKGLANVYEFLALKYPKKIDSKVHEQFLKAGDLQGKIVGENATAGSLCEMALKISMGAYGSEAGCCSLKFIPTGGLFVTGGLTPKNIQFIEGNTTSFMVAYKDKGRVSSLLDSIPIFAVMTQDMGMRGAKVCAMQEFARQNQS